MAPVRLTGSAIKGYFTLQAVYHHVIEDSSAASQEQREKKTFYTISVNMLSLSLCFDALISPAAEREEPGDA